MYAAALLEVVVGFWVCGQELAVPAVLVIDQEGRLELGQPLLQQVRREWDILFQVVEDQVTELPGQVVVA